MSTPARTTTLRRARALLASLVLVLALVLALGVSACASTTLEQVWRSPSVPGAFEHVLVFGISKRPGMRREFESTIAAALADKGIQATPAFTLFPNDGPDLRDEEIARVVAEHGFDAVLVTRLVGVTSERRYVSTADYMRPSHGFYEYYHYGYESAYTTDQEVVVLDTNLYAAASAELVWSGLSKTFAAKDVADSIKSYSRTIVAALLHERLVVPT
jgi:hypothetical protein